MIEFFTVLANSWPIAAMVIGVSVAIAVRRSFKQAMDNARAERIDRAQGNGAVVVQRRQRYDGDEG